MGKGTCFIASIGVMLPCPLVMRGKSRSRQSSMVVVMSLRFLARCTAFALTLEGLAQRGGSIGQPDAGRCFQHQREIVASGGGEVTACRGVVELPLMPASLAEENDPAQLAAARDQV